MLIRLHSPSIHLGLALLACTVAQAGEGTVSVNSEPIVVTVGIGAEVSVPLTVSNTGSGPLTMRLRDAGSGTGGTPGQVGTIATYGSTDTLQTAAWFDGLRLWQVDVFSTRLISTRLETGGLVSSVALGGGTTPILTSLLASDGDSIWVPQWFGEDLMRFDPDSGAQLSKITVPGIGGAELLYEPFSNRIYAHDQFYSFSMLPDGTDQRREPQFEGTTLSGLGSDAYDGSIWHMDRFGDRTKVFRRSLSTGAVQSSYSILSSAAVAYYVHGITTDGWGRFVVLHRPNKDTLVVSHVDTGVRGWMTCAEATAQAVVIPPGGQQVFNLRLNATAAGIGSHNSIVFIDSDDEQTTRVRIPGQFTVENRSPDAPLVRDDAYIVTTDAVLTVDAPGVLANDDGVAPMQAQLVSDVSHGQLSLASNGSFTYDPAEGYVGDDSFTYRLTDGLGRTTTTATVTIMVDFAPIPEIAVTPAPITVSTTPGTTAEVTLNLANIGYGTLLASLRDLGTGGSPSTVIREATTPTNTFASGSVAVSFASAGDSVWVYSHAQDPLHVHRVDLDTGITVQSVATQSDHILRSIAWDGSKLWMVDYRQFDQQGGTIEGPIPVAVIDPVSGSRVHQFTLPFAFNYLLTADDTGHIWAISGSNTYQINASTYSMIQRPSISLGTGSDVCWYAGSLWSKNRGIIERFDPETGSKITGRSWSWIGSDDYETHQGFAHLGFGRFLIAGGPRGQGVIRRVDSGIRGWMQSSALSVAVDRQSSENVTLSFHGALAGTGVHQTALQIFSNDTTDPIVTIPITFTVGGTVSRSLQLSLNRQGAPLSTSVLLNTGAEAAHGAEAGESSPVLFPDLVPTADHTATFGTGPSGDS